MAENEAREAFERAMHYGTVNTTSLFEKENGVIKISRVDGILNFRMRWSSIFGMIVLGIPGGLIVWLFLKIFGSHPISIIFIGVIFLIFIIIGYKLGQWSPMAKTTGEDFLTWVKIVMRNRLVMNENIIGGKKPSEVTAFSVIEGSSGKNVPCTVFLGTQPVYNAPPRILGKKTETPYDLSPRGEFYVVPTDDYDDGLEKD